MLDHTDKATIDYLIVDNQEERRIAIESFLSEKKNLNLVSVGDAKTAREILFTQKVKFVIAAYFMPKMTGLELLHIIRQTPYFLNLPVIILLDENQNNPHKLFAEEEGADHVLTGQLSKLSLQTAVTVTIKKCHEQTQTQTIQKAARSLFLQKKYDQAICKTLKIENISNNPEALYLLCECYYQLKNYDKAIRYLKELLATPTSRTMHLFSKICLADGRCGDAITHLTNATLRYPTNLELKITLGKLYLSLGMKEQATDQFEAVQQGAATDINLIKIGDAYLNQGMLEQAGTFYNMVEKPIPESTKSFAEFAKALETEGDTQAAVRQYEKCLQLRPDHPKLLLNLGKLYIQINRRDKARKIIDNLQRRFPENEKISHIYNMLHNNDRNSN